MIPVPKCFDRGCKNYVGVRKPDGTEETERPVCLAFPDRIPPEISYGDNKHIRPLPNQGNEIVFEKEE